MRADGWRQAIEPPFWSSRTMKPCATWSGKRWRRSERASSLPESAAEARAAAAGTHIDLLLTDVGLPRATGTELATELRAAQPALRVIYMTGWQEHNALADVPDGLL